MELVKANRYRIELSSVGTLDVTLDHDRINSSYPPEIVNGSFGLIEWLGF